MGAPLSKLYRYVPPHRVGFLPRLGLKTGIHFAHFGLESDMVLEETTGLTGLYERLYRFNSRWVRKKENVKNMRIRNGLKNFEFVYALIYVMITKVLPKGHVWKQVWISEVWSENECGKLYFLLWNRFRNWRTGRRTPTKNSQEYPRGK